MTISAISTIENSSKSLFIEQPENKYTKISKDLHKLMMTGCSQCTAAAYHTYSFCISMHPDSVITPAKIAASLKTFADQTGGRSLSERTIRRHLAMLEKVDLVEREYLKDKEGKFLGGLWRFFSLPTVGQKRPMDKSDDNVIELKEKIAEKQNEPIGQKGPPVYNKERARVCKTKSKTKCSSSAAKDERATTATTSFPENIEKARTNGPKISVSLVSKALEFGEAYVLEAIKYSREKNHSNPGSVFRGAAEERYKSIDLRIKQKQPPQPSSNQIKQTEIQDFKNENFDDLKLEFLDKFKNNDVIYKYYNNLDNDRFKDDGEFNRFTKERYEAQNETDNR